MSNPSTGPLTKDELSGSPAQEAAMTMDRKTLRALRGSIKKWEGVVAGTTEDKGSDNCPLCQLFNKEWWQRCYGCPVRDATGQSFCFGTPYEVYRDRRTKTNAKKELKFLQSLLPPSPRKPR